MMDSTHSLPPPAVPLLSPRHILTLGAQVRNNVNPSPTRAHPSVSPARLLPDLQTSLLN